MAVPVKEWLEGVLLLCGMGTVCKDVLRSCSFGMVVTFVGTCLEEAVSTLRDFSELLLS